jgi:hypothetical protein
MRHPLHKLVSQAVREAHRQPQEALDARPVMGEVDAFRPASWGGFVVALVPMPGKLKFDQDWLEWYFLMHDEAALNDDVFVYLTARTVEHIRNSK